METKIISLLWLPLFPFSFLKKRRETKRREESVRIVFWVPSFSFSFSSLIYGDFDVNPVNPNPDRSTCS